MPEWMGALTGLLGVGLAGTLWWGFKEKQRLSQALAELEDAQASAQQLDKTLREVESERADLASEAEDLRMAVEQNVRRTEELDEGLASAQRTLAETALSLHEREEELVLANDKVRNLEASARNINRSFADLRARDRRNTELLRALGANLTEGNPEPFDPEMRAQTRQSIQQLLVDCGARASALADDHALLGASAGDLAGAERIAMAAGAVSEIEAELAAVLCSPVQGWSVMDRRFCTHLLRMNRDWWLGVENLSTAPLFAMRQCALRLVGLEPSSSDLPAPSTSLALDEAPDEKLSVKLTRWSARWSAQSVTVLDVEGRPFGATPSAQASTVMALGRKLRPLQMRMDRDGRMLEDLSLVARAKDGTTLMLRTVGEDMESPLLAVLARTEIPEEALDELCGLIRWHAPSAPTLAAV